MKCIIIEDELPAQGVLKNYIKKFEELELLKTFQTAINANSFLKETTVDLIFLDINLPDISGLNFIKTVKNPPKIIITTAYPDYALDSFELETIVDYLVKPFSLDRFLKAITKAEKFQLANTLSETSDTVFLNVDKALHKIKIADIKYIESDRNYLTFITTTQKISILDSLKNWNKKLTKHSFIQVHKSYLVNLNKITKLSGNTVFIENIKIPVGWTFKKKLMAGLQASH